MRRIKLFSKEPQEVIVKEQIEFIPAERKVNTITMFHDAVSAQSCFDYVYNKYVKSLLDFDSDKAQIYKDMLTDIRQISKNCGFDVK